MTESDEEKKTGGFVVSSMLAIIFFVLFVFFILFYFKGTSGDPLFYVLLGNMASGLGNVLTGA